MLVGCPKCKTKYRIDDNRVGPDGIKLRCSKCETVFRVVRKAAVPPPAAAPAPAPAQQPSAPAPGGEAKLKILIGHESAAFCSAVRGVLAAEPFELFACHDGEEALAAAASFRPDVALLDVALPKMFGFEVCEAIKNNPVTSRTKVILIAAIYDKTRYKRMPASLYAADDYIEKHHIPDDLVAKVYRLVSGQQPLDAASAEKPDDGVHVAPQPKSEAEQASFEATREELRQDEATATTGAAPAPLPESHVKAKRLARIIVSDIALYNQAKVEEGVRNGTFFDLLEGDIKEGRALYLQRIPEEVRAATDYLEDAFREMIAKIRKELNL